MYLSANKPFCQHNVQQKVTEDFLFFKFLRLLITIKKTKTFTLTLVI